MAGPQRVARLENLRAVLYCRQQAIGALRRWIGRHRRVFVLTGAGCSTASGIPDYRDANGEWKRRPPVMFQAFRSQPEVYRRYLARAYAGWPRFTAAAPGDVGVVLTEVVS